MSAALAAPRLAAARRPARLPLPPGPGSYDKPNGGVARLACNDLAYNVAADLRYGSGRDRVRLAVAVRYAAWLAERDGIDLRRAHRAEVELDFPAVLGPGDWEPDTRSWAARHRAPGAPPPMQLAWHAQRPVAVVFQPGNIRIAIPHWDAPTTR